MSDSGGQFRLEQRPDPVAGPGDAVVGPGGAVVALVGGGGRAERIAVPADLLLPVPDPLSWQEAAGFPEAFGTVHGLGRPGAPGSGARR
ncbi:hypothetical protein AB0B50_27785 [Streptomyces sp. NPDC041068]|uniref:hypothetical protein n=1 Tax=Streptomyces sp. NPDC041068 TaxID=3155130 RepID=UPI003405B955